MLSVGGPAEPGRVWRGPPKTKDGVRVCSPRRRKPSPTGKVDRAQPGPDEGPSPAWRGWTGEAGTGVEGTPKNEGRGTMNEKISPCNRARRMFQRSAPHPSGPLALPPSPWGKATSRRGTLYFSPPWTCRGPLHTRRKRGHPRKAQRARDSAGKGADTRSDTLPPHTRQGLRPCHPLPGEGRGKRRLRAFPRFLPPFLCRPRSHG